MRKAAALSVVHVAGILALLAGSQTVWANPVQYHGGPILETFTIVPLYWGHWSEADKDSEQAYLRNLAAYMSGDRAPTGQQPTIQQYGVTKVTVDDKRTADPTQSCIQLEKGATCAMPRDQLAGPKGGPLLKSSIIAQAQSRKRDPLPPFGLHTLIVVFLPHHYVLTGCGASGCGGAFHSSESKSEFWAVIPQDDTPASTAHEVLEASADPGIDDSQGWDEVVDPCENLIITLKDLGNLQIPEVVDNTRGGACNPTGYTPIQPRFNQLRFDIVTGGDDLRGDSSATASISLPEGPQIFTLKAQSDAGWGNNSDHNKTFTIAGLPLPISLFGAITITLTSHNGPTETDDNWDIRSIDARASGPGGSESCVLKQRKQGKDPLARLTGSKPSVTLHPREGC